MSVTAQSNDTSKKRRLPRWAVVLIAVIGSVAALYLVGVAVFSNVFLPNSKILGRNVSLRTVHEVASGLADRTDAYKLAVTGDGVDLSIPSSDIDLTFDAEAYVHDAISETNPWAWPVELFSNHSIDDARGAVYDHDKVKALVDDAVAKVNETATDPVDATISFDKAQAAFVVVPGKMGTKIVPEKALETVETALDTLETAVTLGEEDLQQPSVTGEEAELATAAEKANSFLKAKLTLVLDGSDAATIDASKIVEWVTLDDNLEATMDVDAIKAWGLGDLSKSLDTVGTERTYTRADGKQVTVVGGTYGWNIDSASLADMIVDGVVNGVQGELEVPTHQTAAQLPDKGGRDWGASYVDVDLGEQHVRFYDDKGALAWESDCVTGNSAEGYDTPTGVYFIDENFNKSNPASTLIGKADPKTGEPEYETPVEYWMPFVGNSIGFHDANWRSEFGGSIYQTNGSHGCVNLPPDKAKELCPLIEQGTVVVVHN